MIPHLQTLISRELDALAREVRQYPDDGSLWKAVPGCPNTGGNLTLHLVGNLRHFIGAQLGKTGYVRNRDAEFATRGGITRNELLKLIDSARTEVRGTLSGLDPAVLDRLHDAPGDRKIETGLWLMHLAVHLGYHLGQIDYHRRAVTGDSASVDALSLQPLVG
jgi:hypothetical protein